MGLKKVGNIYKSKGQAGVVVSEDSISPTFSTGKRGGIANIPSVLVTPKLTNTQSKSTKRTSQNTRTMATQRELFGKKSQISNSSLRAFLAKASQLLGSEADLRTLEELYSSKSQGLAELRDLNYCSWRTSRDFYHTIKGRPLEPSSRPFLTWGMFSNGRYLTARTSGSHRIGRGCSLSGILEENVDQKYFLSKKVTKRILNYKDSKLWELSQQDEEQLNQTGTILLKVSGRHKN